MAMGATKKRHIPLRARSIKSNNIMITVFVFKGKHQVSVQHVTAEKRKRVKAKKVHPVDKNPRVLFFYPQSKTPWNSQLRNVRVIGANDKYLIGLEISDKNRFKKFLKSKITDLQLQEFAPESVN